MPSANNVAPFATSFLQSNFDSQNHSHFPFQSNQRHRPHSCPSRQQKRIGIRKTKVRFFEMVNKIHWQTKERLVNDIKKIEDVI